MTPHLHIDFEIRSTVDLKAAGLDNYARHPTTEPWCMAYAFDDEDVELIAFHANGPRNDPGQSDQTDRVNKHVESGGIVLAHNAAFELAIWNNVCMPRYGWPPLKPEQVRCTMAMAYAMALPGSLEKAAAAVGIKQQKDMSGHRLMLQMSRPRSTENCDCCGGYGREMVNRGNGDVRDEDCSVCRGTGCKIVWWDEPDKLEKLYAYCRQDVEVERELARRLMPLSEAEQRLWCLDQTINNRGISIDTDAVNAAIKIVQSETDRLNQRMREVTGNFVGFCTEVKRLTDWVRTRGVETPGLAKADILELLDRDDLPGDVREALLLRREAGKSSTAKLRAMVDAASADGRLRGMFQYHGAGTGRWAGRKVQLHNMPRGTLKGGEIDEVFEILGAVA